jgi:hypothetical protein
VKIDAKVIDGTPEVVLSEVYSGVGIGTAMGLFGVAERDGGIEVSFNGKTVWTSHEIEGGAGESERTVPGVYATDVRLPLGESSEPLAPGGPGARLPDGSGAFVASLSLPKDHWLYAAGENDPPMPMRIGLGPKRAELAWQIREAARYAIRASTMNGKEKDFDPDAMVQNMVVGLLGYWTSNGYGGA